MISNPNRILIAFALLLTIVSVAGCGNASSSSDDGASLSLVAYSTPKEAYSELIPAFAKTPEGRDASFTQSYGNSGDQARAVIAGLPTDVVALSLEPDVTKLVDEGLVARDWKAGRFRGLVTRSVVVLAVRKGNPKRIRGWDDLVRDDVQVLTPNPFTSGGARWNVMAAYGAQREQGRSDAQAVDYLERLFRNVVVQDKSARDSLQTFAAGKGDVLVSYENEAITAQQKGQDVDYIVPDQTILIENPIAVTTGARDPKRAQAFVDFLRTPRAQRVFASKGYRSVRDSLVDPQRFPTPEDEFTIRDLGGWDRVTKRFFEPEASVMASIERSLGVAAG